MGRATVRSWSRKWRVFALSAVLAGFGAATALPASSALAAAYSCGSYSSGTYSSTGTCAGTTPGGGTTDGVGAPNTGFAKLMQPANLAAIIGSLALIIAGIAVMLRSKSRKKQDVSFDSRN